HSSSLSLHDALPILILRKRGPLRCDYIRDSCFEQTDQLKLALTHDCVGRFDQRTLGLVETKKDLAFLKKRRLRRIQVFLRSVFIFQKATAERNHFADVVADRKHNSPTKAIV